MRSSPHDNKLFDISLTYKIIKATLSDGLYLYNNQ